MSEPLDVWYQRELAYFRRTSAKFAERFPKIAGRLSLSDVSAPDPHVELLIQAVALLNARTRRKLDDGFPELAGAMLGVLYPHMTAPVPSVSVVQASLASGQQKLTAGCLLERGTELQTIVDGERGVYRTTADVRLLPWTLSECEWRAQPVDSPPSPRRGEAEAALRLRLDPLDKTATLSAFAADPVRFYVRLADFAASARLLERLLTTTLEVVVAGAEDDTTAAVLPASSVRHVGFAGDEALFPRPPQTQPGYHLLGEYFVLPEKFLFFEIAGLTPEILSRAGGSLELFLLQSEAAEEFETTVTPAALRTGCTPVVNLFRRTAQGFELHEKDTAYRVVPDLREEETLEVYTVDDVAVTTKSGAEVPCCRFYSVDHGRMTKAAGRDPLLWHAGRRSQSEDAALGQDATETYLTLIPPAEAGRSPDAALEGGPYDPPVPGGTAVCECTCFNRRIPERLSRRSLSQIQFTAAGSKAPVAGIDCLRTPTATIRRHLAGRTLWPLVSQLSLNHLSLTEDDGSAGVLKEILAVNDFADSAATRSLIEGVRNLRTRPATKRLGRSVARGTAVDIEMAAEPFVGDSPFLFAAVLSRFLAMYAGVNSFTQLSATTDARRREGQRPWTWPAAAGNGAAL